MTALSMDLHFINTDRCGIRPGSHGDGAERKRGSTVETIDEIDILHDTFLAERLSTSRELFLGCLKDQLHSSADKLRMGCEDLREG